MLALILFIAVIAILLYIENNRNNRNDIKRKPNEDWHTWYYNTYLKSKHWKRKRKRALCNAGFSCQECGNRGSLQVHHLSYKNLGNEQDYDLKVLCRSCHREVHNI